jgi:hypothetical protein
MHIPVHLRTIRRCGMRPATAVKLAQQVVCGLSGSQMISINAQDNRGLRMGGYFSTRWNFERIRQHTDLLLSLDVRWLGRIGALQPGAVAVPSWTFRGEPSGHIVTRMNRDGDRLTLDYKTRATGETDWTPRMVHVWLDATPCHYGGERLWFRCPHCQSRRAVLFSTGGVFACRQCHDLAYTSTREDAMNRSYRRIGTLQQRLGGGGYGVPVWDIPGKPPRMHWQTYARLVAQLRAEQERNDVMFTEGMCRLAERLDMR